MPIDSSIPLQAQAPKPANWADTMMPYVQMAGAMQNIKESQARMPGIEADAKEKVRIAKRNQLAQDLAQQNSITNPDGTKVLDTEAYKKALASNGLVDEAFQLSGTQLNQQAQEIQNAYHQGMNPVLIAEAKKKLQDSTVTELANTLDQIKDKGERQEYAKKYVPMAVKMYGLNPDDPRLMSALKGDSDSLHAIANVGASPQERAQLAVSQGQLALAQSGQQYNFATAGYTPEGRNPNSAVSQRAREIAKQAGLQVNDNMSLFEMNQIPGFANVLGSAQGAQVVPAEVRAGGLKTAAETGAAIKSYDEAINNAKNIRYKYGNNKIGQLVQQLGTKFTGSPEYLALMTAVQTHNMNFPGDQITNADQLTPEQISAKLKAGQTQLANKKAVAEAQAGAQRFPAPGKQAAPQSGSVRMRNPKTGDIINVPADKVQEAMKTHGLKRE